jgi:signal transduction histidine kinase
MLKAKDLASEPELEAPPAGNVGAVAATVALALFATLVAFRGQGFLPSLFVNEREVNFAHHIAVNSAAIALAIVPMIMLMRQRPSVLDLWLLVALAAWVIEAVLNLPLHARYSAGWYGLFLMMLASSLVVMLALLADSNRLYARLALSTAAREREREARLMTADAVAAAIAHEVGQPLAAVSANVAASVRWLDRPQPNVEKATDSLRAIGESTQRSFDIIENVRAVLGKGPDGSVEFSLNELIRETAAMLGGELAGAKVSLELSLDDDVPPIKANRVQIEQVLINLLTNAVESLVSTRGRRRRIGVRTALAEPGRIRLEVSDNGVGLTPENVSNVFDAFHTTKSKGTGIGLSLCRTIVEEHGGRIWASRGDKHGATFHMLLPCARIAASAAKSKP